MKKYSLWYYFIGDGEPRLFFPAAGYRTWSNGSLDGVGSHGYYWSNIPFNETACYLHFSSGLFFTSANYNRANGFSVRCVSE